MPRTRWKSCRESASPVEAAETRTLLDLPVSAVSNKVYLSPRTLVYDTSAQKGVDCRVALSARGGVTFSGSNSRCDKVGGSGTIYLSDGCFLKRSGRMLAKTARSTGDI